jgi:hypothetical protein
MAQEVVPMGIIVETSCKQVENSLFDGQWKCTHVAWLYVSTPYTSCKVDVDW